MYVSSLFSIFCFNWLFQEIVTAIKHHGLLILKINLQMRPVPWASESVLSTNTTVWVDVAHSKPCKPNMSKSEHITLPKYLLSTSHYEMRQHFPGHAALYSGSWLCFSTSFISIRYKFTNNFYCFYLKYFLKSIFDFHLYYYSRLSSPLSGI